jgi:hypothetical protein
MKDGIYYLFDGMDGLLCNKLLTAEQVRELMTFDPTPYTEKDLKQTAADYEATLYRCEYKDGEQINKICLYDCGY